MDIKFKELNINCLDTINEFFREKNTLLADYFFETLLIYNNTYNQDLGEYATIIEVGDDENTIEEAENSILLFANILKEILN